MNLNEKVMRLLLKYTVGIDANKHVEFREKANTLIESDAALYNALSNSDNQEFLNDFRDTAKEASRDVLDYLISCSY